MPSLTLKNVPPPLHDRLRQMATEDRRSLQQEILFLLEQAVERNVSPSYLSQTEINSQCDTWTSLLGSWESDKPVEQEVREIYTCLGRTYDP